jgi:hypothetical protein
MSQEIDGDAAEVVRGHESFQVGGDANSKAMLGDGSMAAVTVDELKRVIPSHCFKSSYGLSLFYLFRDFVAVAAIAYVAWAYIPGIQMPIARYAAWAIYGYIQGLVFTGLWVRTFTLSEHVKLTEVCRSKHMNAAMVPFHPHNC